jgi:ribosomal protein L44E
VKNRWCRKCKGMADHYIENEEINKNGHRTLEYVCSDCGERYRAYWGRAKTLKFLHGDSVQV